jgi:hypothetical protein
METTQPFTVVKSSVELYKIRHPSGCYWADITIDASGHTGRITIASDYGTWQNYWGACGCEFKTFLGRINESYAATKFDAKEWLSVKGSIRLWKELLVSYRRDETIEAGQARAIYDEIEELASESHRTLLRAFDNTSHLSPFIYRVCGMPEFANEPDPHFAKFWKEIWPVLLAELARESSFTPQSV